MNTVPLRILVELNQGILKMREEFMKQNRQVSAATIGDLTSANARLEVYLEEALNQKVEVKQ